MKKNLRTIVAAVCVVAMLLSLSGAAFADEEEAEEPVMMEETAAEEEYEVADAEEPVIMEEPADEEEYETADAEEPEELVLTEGEEEEIPPEEDEEPEEIETQDCDADDVSIMVTDTWYWPFPGTTTADINGGYHDGIDVAVSRGSAIYAPQNGTIVSEYHGCRQFGAYHPNGGSRLCKDQGVCAPNHGFAEDATNPDVAGFCNHGYGNGVCLLTTDGVYVQFAHMNSDPVVAEGQYVTKGTLLGYAGGSGCATGTHCHYATASNGEFSGFFDPRDISYTYSLEGERTPVGVLDVLEGTANGTIHIRGWAFDYDDLSADLVLHVYVGGDNNQTGHGYVTRCNHILRNDVNDGRYGNVGSCHGFDLELPISERGSQPVYVFAIDAGERGHNKLLEGNLNGGTVTVSGAGLTGITLNKSSLQLSPGASEKLTASLSPSGVNTQAIHWSSSNTSVATVNNGTVTAVSDGTAVITAALQNYSSITDACTVTVSSGRLKVTGLLDGAAGNSTAGYGTFNVYINNVLDAQGVTSYNKTWPNGTRYSITNIRAADARHKYMGASSNYASLSGTISGTVNPQLRFATIQNAGVLTVSAAEGSRGDVVEVSVCIGNNPGITDLLITPEWSEDNVQLLLSESGLTHEFQSGKYKWTSGSVNQKNGELFRLVFRIRDDAAAGEVPISFTCSAGDMYNNQAGKAYAPAVTGGVITVEASSSAETTGMISVSEAKGRAGDEVTVDVSIDENPGITALTLSFDYDRSRLSYVGFEDAGFTDWTVANKAVWLGNSDSSYNGVILKLKFRILDNAAEGDATVTVTCGEGDMVDSSEAVYIPAVQAGTITVYTTIPGDINGDGSIDARDLVRLKRSIAGEEVELAGSGDTTGDGKVDARDLVRLKNYIAGVNVELH